MKHEVTLRLRDKAGRARLARVSVEAASGDAAARLAQAKRSAGERATVHAVAPAAPAQERQASTPESSPKRRKGGVR